MNPHLLKVSTGPHQSFNIRHDVVQYFYNRWHFHPEIELLHIQKGTGLQFIGDSIQRFKKDDVILVGANLPHLWRCDDAYFQKSKTLRAQSNVIHFKEDFWGERFLELPENKKLKQLLEKAKRGISISGATRQFVIAQMEQMLEAKDSDRIVLLLQILGRIAQSKQLKLISSAGFSTQLEQKSTDKINSVYAYTLAHFKEKISLKKIAEVSNISPNSFCRYFKVHTRKTYSNFLHELRVGHASKLLIENKLSISQICYESGFNNVTNFYKTFKRFTGQTPLAFQQMYNTTAGE
ncbi:AraC family transcriptional regulator [Lacibacter luteus]|uniref:AraC family transcriptional regulator n=1 Tax=Lacibacter luteus TaxID=2508719 RepID=A0A4Q1CKV0_9BACT|nr:AraC family transcriptional regulator [Lacibacter luteus]RXK61550.1 AraC family transcriptional regulator [Lacibacter luteus]